jgi:hypothetical protein
VAAVDAYRQAKVARVEEPPGLELETVNKEKIKIY